MSTGRGNRNWRGRGNWRGRNSQGRSGLGNGSGSGSHRSLNSSADSQLSQSTGFPDGDDCQPSKFKAWKFYFPSERYNDVSESGRLSTFLEIYLKESLGVVSLDDLEQTGSYLFDYKELKSNKYLTEVLPNLEDLLKNKAERFLAALGVAFHQTVTERFNEMEEAPVSLPFIQMRIQDFGNCVPITSLKAAFYGKFISVKGTVARVTSVRPLCTTLAFQCSGCDNIFAVHLPDGKYTPPGICMTHGCQSRTFNPLRTHTLTKTVDSQQIRLQENLTSLDGDTGRVPRTLDCELLTDLVGACVPGDVATVAGVIKVATETQGKGKNKDKCTFLLNLRANSVIVAGKRRTQGVNSSSEAGIRNKASLDLNTRDLYCIQTIYEQKDVFKLLVHSLCPTIYGHELVKAALLLGLFGGSHKFADAVGRVSIRGDPHILVVGDPGLGKSQMLQAASTVAPRGVYVCGNTSTSSGLTVTLSRESGSGDYSLEAGALVLADQGVCCIDEFDKMGQQHQALLEAMEQQSISIAKAGIVCSLPARTSVLAAANPVGGHYNKAKTVAENLKMSGPLLSRFDLVFILLDKPDEEMDSLLSSHVMALHGSTSSKPLTALSHSGGLSQISQLSQCEAVGLVDRLKLQAGEKLDLLPHQLLRKYISYARDYVHPKINKSAAKLIQEFYLELRRKHHSSDSTPITTRQLEALVRLTEARARLELQEEATSQHADDIIQIMKHSMIDTYSDDTGVLDFTRTQNGAGMSNRSAAKALVAAMQSQAKRSSDTTFQLQDINLIAQRNGIRVKDFESLISSLNQQGYLLKKGRDIYKLATV